ncbi:hypothetical protein GTX07_00345, partial [Streptomyces sp. SID5606]|nr:hypothetical protein [Streptomyces sp. SID5606]
MPTIVASAGTMAGHGRSRPGGGSTTGTATGEAPLELSGIGRRAFSALAGTTVLGLALGGSGSGAALPPAGASGP